MTINHSQAEKISIRTLGIVFGAAALTLVAASAPATLVPALARSADSSFAIQQASGTFWRGELKGVTAQGVFLGDVRFRTNPLSLLTGRLAADVEAAGGALVGKGKIVIAPAGLLVVSDAKFVFSLDAANRYAILGTPLSGTVRAEINHISVSKQGCLHGSAQLWTDVLVAPARRVNSEAFDLAGEGVCKSGNFVIALNGEGGEGEVSLALSISPSLTYVLNAEAQPARREVADALQVLGFERANGVLTIGATGAIRTVGS